MLKKVILENFKRFERQEFNLDKKVVLAGPNNSGKTTLLQAISTWHLVLTYVKQSTDERRTRRSKYAGFPIARGDFTSVPLREMNMLWHNRSTSYRKDESGGEKPGKPKQCKITLIGDDNSQKNNIKWELTVGIGYQNKQMVYVYLYDEKGNAITSIDDIPPQIINLGVVHVPPFSGIAIEERWANVGYQNLMIGQGKPGDILRNVLLEVYQEKNNGYWERLKSDIFELFGCELLDINYSEYDPFIVVEYRESGRARKVFDIASAGSGFQQVLMLLGFIYSKRGSIFLLDEPDAHEHVILQRQILKYLDKLCNEMNAQLIISTHSEVIIENTSYSDIISFYGSPHRLEFRPQRDEVREALKILSNQDILNAEKGYDILYLEDQSDLDILREWARILEHDAVNFLNKPFFYPLHGNDPKTAKNHFFALKAIKEEIKGILILDGDNRAVPDHDISSPGLEILRWQRYEIESYLIQEEVLRRFLGEIPPLLRDSSMEMLKDNIPAAALRTPLEEHEFWRINPVSKSILPEFFLKAGVSTKKNEYYMIAADMKPEEIHPEIKDLLDRIATLKMPLEQ